VEAWPFLQNGWEPSGSGDRLHGKLHLSSVGKRAFKHRVSVFLTMQGFNVCPGRSPGAVRTEKCHRLIVGRIRFVNVSHSALSINEANTMPKSKILIVSISFSAGARGGFHRRGTEEAQKLGRGFARISQHHHSRGRLCHTENQFLVFGFSFLVKSKAKAKGTT
jgi:hypothetical protein